MNNQNNGSQLQIIAETNLSKSRTVRLWVTICVAVVVITLVNAFLAFRSISELAKKQQSVTNTSQIITTIKDLHHAVLLAESGQRGYLLTDDEDYLSHYHLAMRGLQNKVDSVLNLRTELPLQKDRILQLIDLVYQKKKELIDTVELAQSDEERKAVRRVLTGRGRNIYLEIYSLFMEIEDTELNLQAKLYADMLKSQMQTRDKLIIASVISVLLVIFLFYLLQRTSRRESVYRTALEQKNRELELKVAERTQELTLYSDELSRSNRELEDFAFVASHDLQEPLRKIQAFANRIQSIYADRLDEKGNDYLMRMNSAASRMSLLISDLLEFSRIKTRGKEFVPVNLNEVLETILDDMEIAISESDATFDISELPTINADETQINRLFLNLISNAVKFRRPQIKPHISISCKSENRPFEDTEVIVSWYIIKLRDNGIGFLQEYADKIFLPFQRLHGRSDYNGTGIGLAICRRIVERHGGSIVASSAPDEGTEFTIAIPVETLSFNKFNL